MKNTSKNNITIYWFVLTIFLIAASFYFMGYLRDLSIYEYENLFKLNLIILPTVYFIWKNKYKVAYILMTILLVLNLFIIVNSRQKIKFEEGKYLENNLTQIVENK